MGIESICRRDVVTVDRDAPLVSAARLMRDEHVGALVVTAASSEGTSVEGVITDRDLVIEALARDLDPGDVTVGDLASAAVVAVPESASVGDTIATMCEEGVRRVLVMGDKRQLIGIVTIDDLLEVVSDEMTDLAGAVRIGLEREVQAQSAARTLQPADVLLLPPTSMATRWRQVPER